MLHAARVGRLLRGCPVRRSDNRPVDAAFNARSALSGRDLHGLGVIQRVATLIIAEGACVVGRCLASDMRGALRHVSKFVGDEFTALQTPGRELSGREGDVLLPCVCPCVDTGRRRRGARMSVQPHI